MTLVLTLCSVAVQAQSDSLLNKYSLEIEPAFTFIANGEVPERNFGAFRPLLQLNWRAGRVVEPHIRLGHLWTWSKTKESVQGVIGGIGARLHFARFLIKNKRVLKNIHLYLYTNLSIANYSTGGDELFYGLPSYSDQILRAGAGIRFPASHRFSGKIEVGRASRKKSLANLSGSDGAFSLIYNFGKYDN